LLQKVKSAQSFFSLVNDGFIGSATLSALNVSLSQRREEIKTALNYIRWSEGLKEHNALAIVNIPSANLYVYDGSTLLLSSRIIAGKRTTPTPLLSSMITEVIIYPYWHVPFKIATRELLPAIKRNVAYLESNNFQVLNSQGKVVDPYSINWRSLSTSYFPYQLRQSTGCDNSLGLLKFNFYNPFSVYLHDTPGKKLFQSSRRFFSHGCMRLEKPIEFALILMKEKREDIERLTKECLQNQTPKAVAIARPMQLVVLYSTAWYNEKGEVRFYEDIYQRVLLKRSA
jgi:murein L,D-transpeptidase YcbB/YkuD